MRLCSAKSLGPAALLAVGSVVVGWVPTFAQSARSAESARPAAGTYTPAKTPDGQPDMQGIWSMRQEGRAVYGYDIEAPAPAVAYPNSGDLTKSFVPIIVDPPDHRIPYQPWAREKRERLYKAAFNPKSRDEVDPQALCAVDGMPRMNYHGPAQVLQGPGYIAFVHELNHEWRVVRLDGRPHLSDKVKLFMGDSRGRWEGNTLVVDVTNHNGGNWLDVAGDFTTDTLHVTERYTLVSRDEIRYEATLEDPKVYTRPWKMAFRMARRDVKTDPLLEDACHEGNHAMETTPVRGKK